ncbi:MAG TPA: class I SAM-dependent methyltransferase [bacterium]
MSEHVGLNVLHPGGTKATGALLERLYLDRTMTVLDVACGKGLSSVALAKKVGCHVVGVDILENSIDKAEAFAKKHRVDHLVTFRVADAKRLPFPKNTFDAAFAQAMLILVNDKLKVVREVNRVLKPGGRSGWIELSWKKKASKEFIRSASKEICAACIANVDEFEGWEKLFKKGGVKNLETARYSMHFRGFRGMVEDEGFANGLKVMSKMATHPAMRKRMKNLNAFFKTHQDYVGYGIYTGVK